MIAKEIQILMIKDKINNFILAKNGNLLIIILFLMM